MYLFIYLYVCVYVCMYACTLSRTIKSIFFPQTAQNELVLLIKNINSNSSSVKNYAV